MIKKRNTKLSFIVYRYKFLLLYIVFGALSLVIELIISTALRSFGFSPVPSMITGFVIGLFSAFILNVRFNFHIVPSKRKKALLYFSIISFFSFCIQRILRGPFLALSVPEELIRFLTAGFLFLFSYLLHRRFSFKEYKKVGIAIYADGVEDIRKIYGKIGAVSDFIHIDIVDSTFKPGCADVKAYRAEVARAYWQDKPIEVHIMSRMPSRWLPELKGHVDIIYVHSNLHEDIQEVFDSIRKIDATPGIVIGVNDNINSIDPFLSQISRVLILAISNPGNSGQPFEMSTLNLINSLAMHPLREKITVCVDGGVNASVIKYLNVESVVSGSFVLNAQDPIKNIMLLQTSGEYERF